MLNLRGLEQKLSVKFTLNALATSSVNPLDNDPLLLFLPGKCLHYGCVL